MAFTWVLDIQTKVLMPMYQNMIKSTQHVNWCLLYPIFAIPKGKLIMETLEFYLLLFCFVLYGPVVRFLLLFVFIILILKLVRCRNFYIFASLEQHFNPLLAMLAWGQATSRSSWITFFPHLLSSVPIHMLLIPTLDQAHHSPRAAWDTQLPPSSLHSTHIRHIGTEPCWSLSVHCCSCCRADCSPLREPGVGHENVPYNHIFTMSRSQVPPVVTDWGGSFQVVPKFGVRLEKC